MGSILSRTAENASNEENVELRLSLSRRRTEEQGQEMMPLQTTQIATVGQDGGGSSNEPRRRVVELPLEWKPEEVNRLISEHGMHVFDATDANGQPILWDAIQKGQYNCAEMLLDYAKNEGITVTFRKEDEDLLLREIENDAYGSVRFILEKLTEKCASVEETSDLLSKHLRLIGERCPQILGDLLKNDKLTIEYARFQVPKAVLDTSSKIPKTMITRTIPDNWRAMNGERGKGLWIEHWEEDAHSISGTLDAQIGVVAKVFCIGFPVRRKNPNALLSIVSRLLPSIVNRRGEHFCEFLHDLHLSVEVFESKTLVSFIDHWFQVYRHIYQSTVILDVLAALAFTICSLGFGPNEYGELRFGYSVYPIYASTLLRSYGTFYLRSFRRASISLIECILLVLIVCTIDTSDRYNKYYTFLISLICILQWIAMFALWQPFERIGTFVSMVRSAVSDSWRFLPLMTLFIVGYSSAFVALHKNEPIGDDEDKFDSLRHAIETLLCVCLGNFEVEMFPISSGFLAIWSTLLLASFIYILPIVLISVLIATVQDIYDRVRSKEKAELRRLRLRIVAKFQSVNASDRAEQLLYVRFCRFLFRCCCRCLRPGRRTRTTNEVIVNALEGAYFHFLVPEVNGLESHDAEWQGKQVATERTVKSEVQKAERNLKEQLVLVDEKMNELTAHCSKLEKETTENKLQEENWRHHVKERMDRMETAMDRILQRLDVTGPPSM